LILVTKNKNQKKSGANRRVTRNQNSGQPRPPQFQSTYTVRNKRLRFSAATAGSSSISQNNLLQLLAVADTTTIARSILSGLRVRKVEIWGPMSSSLAPVVASVEFISNNASLGGPNMIFSDVSLGTSGAYVSASPPRGSMAASWQNPSSSTVMNLVYPQYAIIDVLVDIVLASGQPSVTGTFTTSASAGDVFEFNLDGVTGNLNPVSYAAS